MFYYLILGYVTGILFLPQTTVAKLSALNPYVSYKFLFQSSRNKRGVGILIKNDISFLEEAREADPEDNFLLLRASIKGTNVIIGAVYGPNDYNPQFFVNLKRAIDRLGNWPILIGGDWNCTFSADPIINNIDCLNMADPPNIRHSRLLRDLCTELGLTDPYRLFFRGKKILHLSLGVKPNLINLELIFSSSASLCLTRFLNVIYLLPCKTRSSTTKVSLLH